MSVRFRNCPGSVIVTLFSIIIVYIFYGQLLNQLNQVSFATGGDGLVSYVNSDYHIRYDTSYMRSNSMNYPYGEHVFFCNNQPLLSNTVKFISQNVIDISGYTIGIMNFLMLLFLVITPVILFQIFDLLGVGKALSIFASLGITFMSPQLDRFGGHFSLSYVFAIPWMILLLLWFFKKPTFLLSLTIFLTMIAGALTHFYYYGFFAILLIFFYGTYLARYANTFKSRGHLLFHLFFQLILPFLILQLFYISDHITDRTTYPWGYLYYRAYPQSVFLPLGKPYGLFLNSFVRTNFIDWEGYAYIGILAFLGTWFFLVKVVLNTWHKKYNQVLQVTSDRQVNILFWAALAGLLYSFGLPFILGLEWLVDLIWSCKANARHCPVCLVVLLHHEYSYHLLAVDLVEAI